MTVSARRTARHVHLVRAAALAGEAFGSPAEEIRPHRRIGYASLAWIGIALVAASALFALG